MKSPLKYLPIEHEKPEPFALRLPPDVKDLAESCASELDTSTNRFIIAAIRFYVDAIKARSK